MGAEVAAALAFGVGALMQRNLGALDATSLILGIVGLTALILLFAQPAELAGNSGLIQRVVQGAGDFWLLILCWSYAHQANGRARVA